MQVAGCRCDFTPLGSSLHLDAQVDGKNPSLAAYLEGVPHQSFFGRLPGGSTPPIPLWPRTWREYPANPSLAAYWREYPANPYLAAYLEGGPRQWRREGKEKGGNQTPFVCRMKDEGSLAYRV